MKLSKIKGKEEMRGLFPVEIKKSSVNEEKGTLEAIFSTSNEDRHGDRVIQDGFDLKNFRKNPVILNNHQYNDATEVIGKASKVKVVDGKLQGKITFAVKENPKAKVIFDLYAGGFLRAFSIGFIPKQFKEDDYTVIEKSELLEVSAVSVPANAMALAKSKGIDIDALKQKDHENEPEGDDEVPEGDEVPEADEEVPATDGNGGEDGGGEGDGEGNGEPGDTGGKSISARAKEFENWENGDSEVRFKTRDLAEFEDGTLKRVTIKTTMPRIFATAGTVIGTGKGGIQMLFFPKEDGWTVDDARKWFISRQFVTLENPLTPTPEAEAAPLDSEGNIPQVEIDNRTSFKGLSKSGKLMHVVKNLNQRDRAMLIKAKKAVDAVLAGDTKETKNLSPQVKNQIQKRRINKAIRSLMNVK